MMMTGATDAIPWRALGIPAYGVSGIMIDPNDLRAHGRDERLPVKSFYEGLDFTYRLTKVLTGGGRSSSWWAIAATLSSFSSRTDSPRVNSNASVASAR
jgi:hypothetical protein